jgi:hypothetical protein
MQLPTSCPKRLTRMIIAKYNEDCHNKGCSSQVTTVKKGETIYLATTYPTIFQLIRDCSMKPSIKHHYRVEDLVFKNIIIVVLKFVNSLFSDVCIKKLKCLCHSFYEMVTDVCRLRTIDFSELRKPRIGYDTWISKRFSLHEWIWPPLE